MYQEKNTGTSLARICRISDDKLSLKKVLQTLALDHLDSNQSNIKDVLYKESSLSNVNDDEMLLLLAEYYENSEKIETLLKVFEESFNYYKLDDKKNIKLIVFSSKYIENPNKENFRVQLIHVPSLTHLEYEKKIASHIKRFYDSTVKNNIDIKFPETKFSVEYQQLSKTVKTIHDTNFLMEVDYNNVKYEMLCKLTSKSKKLIVFGQDALTRSKIVLPYFFRWKWLDDIEANIIILNDPTLYKHDKLNGGWFVGDKNRDYASEIANILKSIIKAKDIFSEVNFYGASAGGFSVLAISSFFEKTKVIVDIPQINLLTYHASKEIQPLTQYCFNIDLSSVQNTQYLYRFNVIDRLKASGNIPNLIYLHNINDTLHNNQVREFTGRWLEILSKNGKEKETSFNFITYDQWHLTKGGHFPLNKSSTIKIINEFFELNK